MLGSISKSFVAALGAFLGAAFLFSWTVSPWGSQGKLLELRKDHVQLTGEYKTCQRQLNEARTQRNRAIDLTWDWKKAYEAQGKRLSAEATDSLNASVRRARKAADNSFEAGLMACRAKGAQNGEGSEIGNAELGSDDPGLRTYWSKGAYKGPGTPSE